MQSRLLHELYIPYHSVSKCVPSKWLNILKIGNQTTSIDTTFVKQSQIKANTKLIFVNNKIIDLSKLASKDVYRTIIKTEIEIPTAKSKFEKRVDDKSVSWVDVCKKLYKTAIDTYSRQFQFRIIQNYLHVSY